MEQILLKEIAELQAGYSFRSGITPAENGIPIVQIKDVGVRGVQFGDLVKAEVEDFRPEHRVRGGDVLFTTRGTSRRAAALGAGGDLPEAIFVAQIIALRVRPEFAQTILPAYLAWYLNQPPAQQYLEENAGGSHIPNIRKESLANLSVDLPPIETQRKIAELYELRIKEQELTEEIQTRRGRLIEAALLMLATGKIKEK